MTILNGRTTKVALSRSWNRAAHAIVFRRYPESASENRDKSGNRDGMRKNGDKSANGTNPVTNDTIPKDEIINVQLAQIDGTSFLENFQSISVSPAGEVSGASGGESSGSSGQKEAAIFDTSGSPVLSDPKRDGDSSGQDDEELGPGDKDSQTDATGKIVKPGEKGDEQLNKVNETNTDSDRNGGGGGNGNGTTNGGTGTDGTDSGEGGLYFDTIFWQPYTGTAGVDGVFRNSFVMSRLPWIEGAKDKLKVGQKVRRKGWIFCFSLSCYGIVGNHLFDFHSTYDV